MNLGVVARMVGLLLIIHGAITLGPLAIDWAAEVTIRPWSMMAGLAVGVGTILLLIGRSHDAVVGPREGAAITVASWLVLAAVAAFGLQLAIPGSTYVECWFEAMSGLTTCGSSAFGEHISIEAMTPGTLVFRALLNWMGGVGVIALGLVLLPMLKGGGSFQLFRAEASGLALDRLTPRLADTVRFILVYNLVLNLGVTVALWLVGIEWIDALCHALATISTGGFSTRNASVAGLASPAAEWILLVGMLLGGINFALMVAAMRGQPLALWRSEEVRAYLGVCLVATAIVSCLVAFQGAYYRGDPSALVRHAAFAVVSLGTSTGFAVGFAEDVHGWAAWPPAAVMVLLVCTLGIGCTGSTAGGAKMLRLLLIAKGTRRVLRQFIEPAAVAPLLLDGRPVADRSILMVSAWVACFVSSLVLATIALLLCAPVDLLSALTATFSALTNAGPALGEFGPERSAQAAGPSGMIVLSLCMLIGRLEFLAVLVLLSYRTWRR